MKSKENILGIISVLLWSSSVAFARSLTEQLGTFSAGACIYILSGLMGLALHWLRRFTKYKIPPSTRSIKYWTICGPLFALYAICLYGAIGLSVSREQAIEVGLLNYLWPTFTILISVPLHKNKTTPFFYLGAALAFGGAALSTALQNGVSGATFLNNVANNTLPYFLAVSGAIVWGLYSNLVKRWGQESDTLGIPVFLLGTGLLLGLLHFGQAEHSSWSNATILELIYMAALPGLSASVFWEISIQKGSITFLAICSFFIPLISTIISAIYLDVEVGWPLWIGCILIIMGAIITKRNVIEGQYPAKINSESKQEPA